MACLANHKVSDSTQSTSRVLQETELQIDKSIVSLSETILLKLNSTELDSSEFSAMFKHFKTLQKNLSSPEITTLCLEKSFKERGVQNESILREAMTSFGIDPLPYFGQMVDDEKLGFVVNSIINGKIGTIINSEDISEFFVNNLSRISMILKNTDEKRIFKIVSEQITDPNTLGRIMDSYSFSSVEQAEIIGNYIFRSVSSVFKSKSMEMFDEEEMNGFKRLFQRAMDLQFLGELKQKQWMMPKMVIAVGSLARASRQFGSNYADDFKNNTIYGIYHIDLQKDVLFSLAKDADIKPQEIFDYGISVDSNIFPVDSLRDNLIEYMKKHPKQIQLNPIVLQKRLLEQLSRNVPHKFTDKEFSYLPSYLSKEGYINLLGKADSARLTSSKMVGLLQCGLKFADNSNSSYNQKFLEASFSAMDTLNNNDTFNTKHQKLGVLDTIYKVSQKDIQSFNEASRQYFGNISNREKCSVILEKMNKEGSVSPSQGKTILNLLKAYGFEKSKASDIDRIALKQLKKDIYKNSYRKQTNMTTEVVAEIEELLATEEK